MNKKIQAIGFDWTGVVYVHPVQLSKVGAQFLGISQEVFKEAYFKHNHLRNLSEIGAKEFWRIVFRELRQESRADAFSDLLDTFPQGQINTEILPIIWQLKKQGYRMGLLSNNSLAGATEARAAGVDALFDVTIFSAEVGVMKPDPKAFELLANRLAVPLDAMVFIDDTEKSLARADEAGFVPVLYRGIETLVDDLKKLGLY